VNAVVRRLFPFVGFVVFGCGGAASGESAPDLPPLLAPPQTGFQIATPAKTLAPGEERTLCYLTRIPASEPFAVKRFVSRLAPGCHHMDVMRLSAPAGADGTLTDCDALAFSVSAMPAYGAQAAEDDLALPEGVAIEMDANQPIAVKLHYLNASTHPIDVRAAINLETVAKGAPYVRAASFTGSTTQIHVPARGSVRVHGACSAPRGAKFFRMTTHSHRFTTRETVSDGDAVIVDTHDWEHAKVESFEKPFFEFKSGKVSFDCEYTNTTDREVGFGASAQTDEMCVALGYFFPADSGPVLCSQ
jgi:hypothetical protein